MNPVLVLFSIFIVLVTKSTDVRTSEISQSNHSTAMRPVVNYGKPNPPRNLKCVSYNRVRMVCSYEPVQQPNGMQVNYSVFYRIRPVVGAPVYHCRVPGNFSCAWTDFFQDRKIYYVYVRAKNRNGGNYSYIGERIDANKIVKPNKVKSLQVKSRRSTSLYLSWRSPFDGKMRELRYKAEYSAGCDEQVMKDLNSTQETQLMIGSLKPNTKYCIIVRAKPIKDGYWSDPEYIEAKTLTDVPSALPITSKHGYQLLPMSEDSDHVTVRVYWQRPDESSINGILKGYRVSMTTITHGAANQTEITHISPDENLLEYFHKINVHKKYAFTVAAASDRGYNESLQNQPIIISPTSVLPPKDVSAFIVNGSVLWVNWTQVPSAENYVLFWCHGKLTGNCEEGVDWQHYKGNRHNATLHMKNGFVMFAVSVQQKGLISGMSAWTKCLYIYQKKSVAPSSVSLAYYQQSGSLSLEWAGFDCGLRLKIIYFIISYCQVDNHRNCAGIPRNITVDPKLTQYTVLDLEADETYGLWMYSVAPSGVSEPSDMVTGRVVHEGSLTAVVLPVALVLSAAILFLVILSMFFKERKSLKIKVPSRPNFTRLENVPGGILKDEKEDLEDTDEHKEVKPAQNGFCQENMHSSSTVQSLSSTNTTLTSISNSDAVSKQMADHQQMSTKKKKVPTATLR